MAASDWCSQPTLGGDPLTSRLSGRRVAASDHCVAVTRRCATCGNEFLVTATTADCPRGCPPMIVEQRFGQAPTVVTGL